MLLTYPATHPLIGMLFGVSLRDPLVLSGSMAALMPRSQQSRML